MSINNHKIGIAVPHYGDKDILLEKLRNLKEYVELDERLIVHVHIDSHIDPMTLSTMRYEFKKILEDKDEFVVFTSDWNAGLTHARYHCIEGLELMGCDYIMFSNSDDLFNRKVTYEDLISRCTMDLNFFKTTEDDPKGEGIVPYDNVLNGRYQDMIPVFKLPENWKELYFMYEGEKYAPESGFFLGIALNQNGYCSVSNFCFCIISYSDGGMTSIFSRNSVTDNKRGYYDTTRFILNKFQEGIVTLSHDKLKNLIDNLVTCGDEVPLRYQDSDFITAMLIGRLLKWSTDPNHAHKLKFDEEK